MEKVICWLLMLCGSFVGIFTGLKTGWAPSNNFTFLSIVSFGLAIVGAMILFFCYIIDGYFK